MTASRIAVSTLSARSVMAVRDSMSPPAMRRA